MHSGIRMLLISVMVIIMAIKGEFRGENPLPILGITCLILIIGAWWIWQWLKEKRKNGVEDESDKVREKQVNSSAWTLAAKVFCWGAVIAYYILKRMGKQDVAYTVGACVIALYVIRIFIGLYYDIKDRKK